MLLFVCLAWSGAASAAPACDTTQAFTHDPTARFEAGYYRHPWQGLIEVLAVTDRLVSGLVYARNVEGGLCGGHSPLLEVVWSDGKAFRAPDCVFASVSPRRDWVRLVDGCYVTSRTVTVVRDGLLVR